MLRIHDSHLSHNCQGVSRRDFLRVGACAASGLSLAGMMQTQALANSDVLTGRSVVMLFLSGGPTHIEFFDPKMTAPSEIHSITGEIQTALPGVTFGATFPKLAKLADRFSVVRSYGTGNGGHTYGGVVSGNHTSGASASSMYARVRGNNHPQTGLPTNVVLLPEAVQDGLKLGNNFETGALPTLTQPGTLGSTWAAFNPSGGGDLKRDMELTLGRDRFGDRRKLLSGLDQLRRQADARGALAGVDTYQQQAFDIITRGVAEAFDLSKEDPRTVASYETSHLFKLEELTRWNDMRRASNLLGRQMLLARRLVEAGCGFVTVSDCGWDYHANGNSPRNMAGIHPMGGQVDHAVAAFLEDIEARGLSDRILLVVTGEMGRSPRINNNGGREHYGELTPLLIAGGGLQMGQVVGQSDRYASRAVGDAYRPQHLFGTIMHSLFDIGRLRLQPQVPVEIISAAEQSTPITPLLG
ncbi:MAG: DUF1501 domain-containing protein [Planctomycetales bacterium]|jgi:uncharacterized protein (DUF1501 family)